MKTFRKSIVYFATALAVMTVFTFCKKEADLANGGEPKINYVRVTNPASSDSLLIGAPQGKLVAIIGENLGGAVEMWFNDQKASLNPTFITPTSIIVNVPAQIPLAISNKLKIVFNDGKTLLYDFTVQISKHVVSSMVSEFVNTGEVATIRGNYFYAPLTVTFANGVNAEIVSVKDQELQVRVPAGAQPGTITVKTNFGETKSNFFFRDDRGHFIDSDPYEGWWNSSYVVTNPGPGDPVAISGNYIRISKLITNYLWTEVAGGPASAMPIHSKNIPDAAILKPEDYNMKFEVNTMKPYTSNTLKINVGLNDQDNNGYQWKPPIDTKGQWQTIVIPFEEVVASYAVKPTVNPAGYWSRLLFHGPGDLDADISFDNFRIVPKVVK